MAELNFHVPTMSSSPDIPKNLVSHINHCPGCESNGHVCCAIGDSSRADLFPEEGSGQGDSFLAATGKALVDARKLTPEQFRKCIDMLSTQKMAQLLGQGVICQQAEQIAQIRRHILNTWIDPNHD